MPALSDSPMFSLVAHLGREPAAPLRIWLRTAGYKLRPPRATHYPAVRRTRQDAVLAGGRAGPHQCADVLVEERPGPLPTIVIGGFVPNAADAFYLLRAGLTPHGSVFYFNYPRGGFSIELFLAQLEDLIEEIVEHRGRRPALVGVSFGAGLVLELLQRSKDRGPTLPLAGLVLISPVACSADLLDRVIRPYLVPPVGPDEALVEKSRAVFLKMFESGALNRDSLRFLLTREETVRLRESVVSAINAIDGKGAAERVRALCAFEPLLRPRELFAGPVLVLYAEKENAVLVANSPTRRELQGRLMGWFPRGRGATVTNTPDNPVQHASLIFHAQNFQPHFTAFYRALRLALRQAA